jgi:hypothetical protein
MSAVATTAPSHTMHPRGTGRRGRGRGGRGGNLDNRGGSGRNTVRTNGKNLNTEIVTPPQKEVEPLVPTAKALVEKTITEDNDVAICFICAEPVKYYSVSECKHRTCHVCALRLRALYKKTDCTFCKVCVPLLVERSGLNLRNRILKYLLSLRRPPMQNFLRSIWNP